MTWLDYDLNNCNSRFAKQNNEYLIRIIVNSAKSIYNAASIILCVGGCFVFTPKNLEINNSYHQEIFCWLVALRNIIALYLIQAQKLLSKLGLQNTLLTMSECKTS